MGEFAWQPSGRYLNRSRVRHFMDVHGIRSWHELIRRSTIDIEWFCRGTPPSSTSGSSSSRNIRACTTIRAGPVDHLVLGGKAQHCS